VSNTSITKTAYGGPEKRSLRLPIILFLLLKTSGWRSAPPKKKPPFRATNSNLVLKWLDYTPKLEPISKKKSKPSPAA
jgi:hypothetical protein